MKAAVLFMRHKVHASDAFNKVAKSSNPFPPAQSNARALLWDFTFHLFFRIKNSYWLKAVCSLGLFLWKHIQPAYRKILLFQEYSKGSYTNKKLPITLLKVQNKVTPKEGLWQDWLHVAKNSQKRKVHHLALRDARESLWNCVQFQFLKID